MEQSLWEANSHSHSQETPLLTWNSKDLPCSQEPRHWPFTPTSFEWPLPFRFSDRNFLCISHLSHACYIPTPHPNWFNHPNNTLLSVQVMKLLIMQPSPASHHFLTLRSEYPPQHPVLTHPQPKFLPYSKRRSFTSIQNNRENYGFVGCNHEVLRRRCKDNIPKRMVVNIPRI